MLIALVRYNVVTTAVYKLLKELSDLTEIHIAKSTLRSQQFPHSYLIECTCIF